MFFVKITDIENINTYIVGYNKNLICKGLFQFYKILGCSINTNKFSYYLICTLYSHMIIIHSYLEVSLLDDKYICINYIKSNNIIRFKFLNPALLILSIYSIVYYPSIRILILEVNSCNLYAFSVYYWFGFQVINTRYNYYHNYCNHYLFNTAYTLVNMKFLAKNILRRHIL